MPIYVCSLRLQRVCPSSVDTASELLPQAWTVNVLLCYRYMHYFHLPLAHMILYGILKDHTRLWLRPPKVKLVQGNEHVFPAAVRKKMTSRAPQIQATGLFSCKYEDIVKCAPGRFLSLLLREVTGGRTRVRSL